MTMVLMIIFAFDPALHHHLEYMVPVAVLLFASNNKRSRLMLSILLDPIVNDLVQLEHGMRVLTIDRVILFKAHCLLATGDTLAAADLLGHLGHLSLYPCRICIVPATRVGQASRLGGCHGIFLGLDELHVLGQNVGKLIIKILCEESSGNLQTTGNIFSLDDDVWDNIGWDLNASLGTFSDSGVFDIRLLFPTSSNEALRGVDILGLVKHLLPAFVVPQIRRLDARDSLQALNRVFQIAGLCKISEHHLTQLDRDVHCWMDFFQNEVDAHALPVSVFTPTMHQLYHLAQAVHALGPPFAYSCRSRDDDCGVQTERYNSAA
ncbi:hypothetical protein DM01DRAFT_1174594 [Hesseltinella vesiculosa]|uniref:Uncharacterized protein n=1 Tax=Hesseltinella vesiculosa TaxID=101127 RepID=A0A1X2G588_9FUNG|nr:hypothetical protein DM01DRAFT_1174594 [Hesseltinella vesiculosa]